MNYLEKLAENYGGKFVATLSFYSIDVIASCTIKGDILKMYNKAIKKASDPVIFYVPKKGQKFAYSLN